MHNSYPSSYPDQQESIVTDPNMLDPTEAGGALPLWVPPSEGQPAPQYQQSLAANTPEWPREYGAPVAHPVPAEGGSHEKPESVHPEAPSLMDGKNHGAFVAPVAPVESDSEAGYTNTPAPQLRLTVEQLAEKRGLTTTQLHAQYPALKRGLHYINNARERGIHH